MNEKPLVSVIIPAYNAEEYVADAIDSALAQTYRPIEIIVADDGSTDGTAAVVQSYNGPVQYHYRENAGPAAARNLGLEHARGEYIAFLDADDLWHPQKVEVQVQTMEEQEGVGICGAGITSYRLDRQDAWGDVPDRITSHAITHETVLIKNRFATSTVMIRSAALRDAGKFYEGLFGPEDWDLWRRILRSWEGLHLEFPLAAYRERARSVSGDAARMLKNNLLVNARILRDNPKLSWVTKQRGRSFLHLDAALEYMPEHPVQAAGELLKSILYWPLPGGWPAMPPLIRARLSATVVLAALGMRRMTEDPRRRRCQERKVSNGRSF